MNKIAEKIYETRKVHDADGVAYDFHSGTSVGQCEFLQNIIHEIDASKCVEVGLAYGMSSMAICEAIQNKHDRVLYSIDPQQDWWKNIGLKNLQDSGYSEFVNFHRDYSHAVLPKLVAEGTKLDFAYVDTTKVFDVVLLDVYYITQMLRNGGVLVLDDCDFPGLNKLARYIIKMPHYKVYRLYDEYSCSFTKRLVSTISKRLPLHRKIFSDKTIHTDCSLGINARCIAFQKVANDERRWDWYTDF